jgi:hypothetical protein
MDDLDQVQDHINTDLLHECVGVNVVPPLISNYGVTADETMQMHAFDREPDPGQDLRNFFEQIMVPEFDFTGSKYIQPPPDLTAWMEEVEYLGELDLFGNNFLPSVGQVFGLQQHSQRTDATPRCADDSNISQSIIQHHNVHATQGRHLAVQNSLWYVNILRGVLYPNSFDRSWFPTRNQHAFSEHENTTIDGQNLDLAASPHQPYESDVVIPGQLSSASRDRIFKLVTNTAQAHISIPSFPDAECLDKLIKVGIAKRIENDAWIHPYTFDSNNALPELLTVLVAAGCVCFGIPLVNRTGLVLQEIARVALNTLVSYCQNIDLADLTVLTGRKGQQRNAKVTVSPSQYALDRYWCFLWIQKEDGDCRE